MKGFDNLKVKSAVKSRNNFDLSFDHLTTMDFGQIVPLASIESVPGAKYSVKGDYFSRMAPLVKPTYGKFSFKTVQAFVPYHQIADDADAWISGKTSWEGQSPRHRYFTVGTLHQFLTSSAVSSTTGATQANADYVYKTSGGTYTYYRFTPRGRYYVKVLNALGYALPQGADGNTSSVWYTTIRNMHLSAYPLLAFFKLYNDYMSQSTRFNTSALSDLLYKIKHGIDASNYWSYSSGAIVLGGLNLFFSNLLLNYENDYFTTAWQYTNRPIAAADAVTQVNVPVSAGTNLAVVDHVDGVSHNIPVQSGVATLYHRALDFLRSFDDWVRRNNYSGSRAVQQMYSRFGIKSDDYRSNYAHVISTDSMPVQVGDVTATANEQQVPLGDYAGKGIMNGSKAFEVETSDFGMVFVFGYFTVRPMNSYGSERVVLRTNPFDFYTPEFDGLGAEAITLGEVFASPIAESDPTFDNQVFGFTERYNSYRYGRDKITGDFRNYHVTSEMNTWHTGRDLADVRSNGDLVAQSSSMNTMENASSQYNRIFSVTSDAVDHFYLTCHFTVNAVLPMMNLNQVVRLGEGETVVPRNGNIIS